MVSSGLRAGILIDPPIFDMVDSPLGANRECSSGCPSPAKASRSRITIGSDPLIVDKERQRSSLDEESDQARLGRKVSPLIVSDQLWSEPVWLAAVSSTRSCQAPRAFLPLRFASTYSGL